MWKSDFTFYVCPSTGRVKIRPRISSSYVSSSNTPAKERYFYAGTIVVDRALLSSAYSCYDKYVTPRASPCTCCNTVPSPSPLPYFMLDMTSTAAYPAVDSSWGTFSLFVILNIVSLAHEYLDFLYIYLTVRHPTSSIYLLFSPSNCWGCFVFSGTETISGPW